MGTPQAPCPDTVIKRKCEDHRRLVKFSCDECKVLICDKCITTTHKAHPMSDIKEFIRLQRNVLMEVSRDSVKYLDHVTRQMKFIEIRIEDNDRRSKNALKKLRKRGEILKKRIDQIVEENVEKCKDIKKTNKECLDRLKTLRSESIDKLQKNTSQCEELYRKNQLDDILKAVEISKTMAAHISHLDPLDATLKMFCFKGSDTPDDSLINDLLGFETVEENVSAFEPQIQVDIDTKKGEVIWGISAVSGGNVIVGYEGLYELEILTSDAQLIESVEVDSCLYDMSFQCLQGNPILLMSNEEKEIQHMFLSAELTAETIFVTKGEPAGLCLTTNSDIIVASSEPTSLVKHDFAGKLKKKAKTERRGKSLLTEPRKMKINPLNGDVYVINSKPNTVVVFNKNLHHQFTYPDEKERRDSSSSQGDAKTTFKPTDLDFDSQRNVLIVDNFSRSIFMLDSFGNFLRTLMIEENSPYSICVHENKSLWVGYEDGTLRVFKYLE